MAERLRVVHYINQYFAGVGGEEEAGLGLTVLSEPAGASRALANVMGEAGTVVATLYCGDNSFHEENEEALAALETAMREIQPDVVIAGPAFGSGRYGLACGQVCAAVREMGIPAVAGMHEDNPGVEMHRASALIVPTGESATEMPRALQAIWELGRKVGSGMEVGPAEVDGYVPTGLRKPVLRDEPGSKRAVDMLVAKLAGKPFRTEVPYRAPEHVSPARPVRDLATAKIALVTTGGLIPKGNPDRAPSANASRFYARSIEDLDALERERWEAFHAGYFTGIVNDNPNYVLPLPFLRDLEQQGEIGEVHETMYTLAGVATPVATCKGLGVEIGQELNEAAVDAVLLVAT